MTKHHAGNERIKRAYFVYLREARGLSEASIDQIAKALDRFEVYTNHRDFKSFHIEQAKAFKQRLSEQRSERSNATLSKATVYGTLTALKTFFAWLAGQSGYKSRISYADAEYFNLNMKDARIAKASREPRVPTLEQIRHVLRAMPATNEIELRDRALIAFTILTGARDGAVASLRLKHIDVERNLVEQDAREVRTKLSKSFPTFFFSPSARTSARWSLIGCTISSEKSYSDLTTHFSPRPASLWVKMGYSDLTAWIVAHGQMRELSGPFSRPLSSEPGYHISTPIPSRKTLAQLGQRTCGGNIEAMKAWSQNLGHEELMTTFTSYGTLSRNQQAEIMASMSAA